MKVCGLTMGAPLSHRLDPAGLIAIVWCSVACWSQCCTSRSLRLQHTSSTIRNEYRDNFLASTCFNLDGPAKSAIFLKSLTPLATIFVVARTFLRITRIKGLGYQDFCIYFAYLMLVVNAVLQTVQVPDLYYIDRVHAELQPPRALLTWNGNQYVKYRVRNGTSAS